MHKNYEEILAAITELGGKNVKPMEVVGFLRGIDPNLSSISENLLYKMSVLKIIDYNAHDNTYSLKA